LVPLRLAWKAVGLVQCLLEGVQRTWKVAFEKPSILLLKPELAVECKRAHSLRTEEKAGFEVISVEPLGGAPEVLADFCAKILRGIPVIGKGAGVLVQRLVWAFISTGTGKKVSEKTGRVFPLAYGLVARKPD